MENSSGNRKGIWIGLGVLIVVILVVIGVSSAKNSNNATGPIKIGSILPLSGDAASYGEPIQQAIDLAVSQLNAQGGINGRQVVMDYEDGKCDGPTASLAAQKLISVDKVQIIIGGACSGETLAAAPIAERNKVLLISPASSAPAITNAGDYIFRTIPSDLAAGQKIADMMSASGAKKVAIISEQTDYAQGVRGAFVPDAKADGMQVVYDDSFPTDTPDFKAFAQQIIQSHPDAVFINPQTGASGARIAKAVRDEGSTAQFFAYFITGDDFVKSGPSVNGTIMLDYSSIANKGLGSQFMSDFQTKYNKAPGYPVFATLGYDTANIIFQAIKNVGYNGTKVKDYLYTMPAYSGITGNITFDKNGDPLGNNLFIEEQVQNQALVPYSK